MKIVITGGNSGIGLEVAKQLFKLGHHPIMLGRDAAKGDAACKALGGNGEFHVADLSTLAGVKATAELLLKQHPVIDAVIHSAGHLTMADKRTADDLHVVFAVNYLSRYHLTQRLLPALRAAPSPKVVAIVAGVPMDTKIDFTQFPRFKPFPGMGALPKTQIANHHYLAWLAKAEPKIRCGATNVGLVKTEIMRE